MLDAALRTALTIVIPLVLATGGSAATTWYVDAAAPPPGAGTPGAPFASIQVALDASGPGDVVSVAPGDYVENVLAPDHPLTIESQGGPLVTTLRTATPGVAFESLYRGEPEPQVLRGFTVRDSVVGVEDDGFAVVVERCILIGNGTGALCHGLFLVDCTVVGNDVGVKEKAYGVFAQSTIVHGNTSWDYLNATAGAVGSYVDCVGLLTISDNVGTGYSNVLFADPELWDLPGGDVHLAPGSPCIGFDGGSDVGALDFDPTYGAEYVDLGFALAGGFGTPSLAGSGWMYPGEPVTLAIDGGPPSGAAWLVLGASTIAVPAKGGTLVPAPDLVVGPLPLDGSGAIALASPWPADLPPGVSVIAQAWMPDAGGPSGFSATNGLSFTAP